MQNQLIKTFCDFVKVDSPTTQELIFSTYLKKKMKQLGYTVTQDNRGNLFTSFRGQGEPLLFAAHIDTVEPGRGIVPVIKKGLITSNGKTILGADNKAIVAALFELMRWAKKMKRPLRSFDILFSVGEEAGISGVDTFDFSVTSAKEAICLDASFPVGTIVLSSPYYLRQEMSFMGKEADVSTAHRGKSITAALGHFLQTVPQGMLDKETFCNIGILQGGHATNALLSHVHLSGEIRSYNFTSLKQHARKMKTLLKTTGEKMHCQVLYKETLENDGYTLKISDSLVKEVRVALKKIVPKSQQVDMHRYWGVSDANNLNKKGIRTLNLGYGVKDPHTVRERIAIADIKKVATLLQHLLLK